MFRPNTLDHPNFTGSNPNFNPLWDGITPGQGALGRRQRRHGIPDSVWVDLGLPVRHTADGRAYKPLFAILCLDMDGRLNLNAHGSSRRRKPGYYQSAELAIVPAGEPQCCDSPDWRRRSTRQRATPPRPTFCRPGGTRATAPIMPRGQGTGPAEVNLLPLFRIPGGPELSPGSYQALLTGNGTFMGRYGVRAARCRGIRGTGFGSSDAQSGLPLQRRDRE